MSRPSSSRGGIPVEKPRSDIYTVMLAISLVALLIACILLWLEGSAYGAFPWWKTPRIM